MSPFDAVPQKTNKILMPNMPNCLNFHSKFHLSLASKTHKNKKKVSILHFKINQITNFTPKTYCPLKIFLTATDIPFNNLPLYTTPYPPSPIKFSSENKLVAKSSSLNVNQYPHPNRDISSRPDSGDVERRFIVVVVTVPELPSSPDCDP